MLATDYWLLATSLTSLAPSVFLSDIYDEGPWRVWYRVPVSIGKKSIVLIMLQELRDTLARVKDKG